MSYLIGQFYMSGNRTTWEILKDICDLFIKKGNYFNMTNVIHRRGMKNKLFVKLYEDHDDLIIQNHEVSSKYNRLLFQMAVSEDYLKDIDSIDRFSFLLKID
jgi:hypothetical protein